MRFRVRVRLGREGGSHFLGTTQEKEALVKEKMLNGYLHLNVSAY